jgi:hypothetical protein
MVVSVFGTANLHDMELLKVTGTVQYLVSVHGQVSLVLLHAKKCVETDGSGSTIMGDE